MSVVRNSLYRKSTDVFTATSLGTGNVKTLLNGGTNLFTPDSIQALLGVTNVIEPQTLTAAQPEYALFELDSPTISLKPKQLMQTGAIGGLGTFLNSAHPIFTEIPLLKRLGSAGVKQLQMYGTAGNTAASTTATGNTSAPLASSEIEYSLDPIDPTLLERFYQVPPTTAGTLPSNFGTTLTGTTAATVTGNSIQVSTGGNGASGFGGFLEFLQALFVPTTITASNSLAGYMTFSSNDIITSEPLKVICNPMIAALGNATGVSIPQLNIRQGLHRPIKSSSLIATAATFDIAPTASGSFCGGIGYTIAP